MIQSLINMFLLMMTFMFTQMKHPLSMGFMLLLQTFIICMITGMMSKSFWFSYILFLVFLGGMLVLFIYVTSLTSNEMFHFSIKLFMVSSIMFFFILLINLIMDYNQMIYINSKEMMELEYLNQLNESYLNINKLYNQPMNFLTLLMIIYLFFTLIVVVKITNVFFGPLRNIN